MAAHDANQSEKTATLFGPDTPFMRLLGRRIQDAGFELTRKTTNHHRLELTGPMACGKTRLVEALADKSCTALAIDVIAKDFRFDGANPTEIVEFRPHRAPHTDN